MEDQDEDEEGEEGIVAETPLLCCVVLGRRLLGNFLRQQELQHVSLVQLF